MLRQLREDIRELDSRVIADVLWFAATHDALAVAPDHFIDVLTTLRDADENAYLSIAMLLNDKVDDVPDESTRTRLRALVIRADDRHG